MIGLPDGLQVWAGRHRDPFRSRWRSAPALAVAAAMVACGDGGAIVPGDRPVVRDSAGIRLVVNPPVGPATPRWALDPEPLLVVGQEDVLPLNRVGGVLLLAEGRMVVANRAEELLFLGPDGGLVRRAGGRGDGPGEFRQLLSPVRLPGDSVAAWNSSPSRVSVFDPDGIHVRDVAFLSPASFPRPLASGGWIAESLDPLPLGEVEALVTESRVILHLAADGSVQDTVARLDGRRIFGTRGGFGPQPLSPAAHLALQGNRVVYGWGGEFVLSVRDPSGALQMRVRNTTPPHPVSPAARDSIRRAIQESRGRAAAAEGRAGHWDPPIPEHLPHFERLLVTAEGGIWVQRPEGGGNRIREWLIHSPGGELLGRLPVPVDFRVMDVRGDRVAGVHVGALDVETVRVFRLQRPE